MARSSKDIAKRLRFDHRPRADPFRRWYWLLAIVACLLAGAGWLALDAAIGERQYLPGPLTAAHATFGDRCAHCHVSFASTPDEKCETCHSPRVHSEFEVATPACRDCHIEHRREELLTSLSDRACVDCHADLKTTHATEVAAAIGGFEDHPQFAPLREDDSDTTALRFNHQLHLTSDDVNEELVCTSCHVVEDDGRYMRPIVFERHCERCHALQVTEVPSPMSEVKAPHLTPAEIRPALSEALLALGARRGADIFAADRTVLLPGRAERGPIDESRSLQEFQRKYLGLLEAALYRPFADSPPLLENNKHCFLCHVQGESPGAGELPVVVETKLPARWLMRGEFSHWRHDKMPCATCHPGIERSTLTAQVNLPKLEVCAQCHADDAAQSAGTDCVLCHTYHDTSVRHVASPEQTLDVLRPPR